MATQVTSSISERALLLLEIIASAEGPPTLNELMAAAGLPKATTHRFLTLLERLGFAQRSLDGKRYEVAPADVACDPGDAAFAAIGAQARDSDRARERNRRDLQHHHARRHEPRLSRSRRIRLAAAIPAQGRLARAAALHRKRKIIPEPVASFAAAIALRSESARAAHAAHDHEPGGTRRRAGENPEDGNWHR